MTRFGKITALALALFFFAAAAFALTPPPAPTGRVNDYAGLFKPEETSALEARLKAIEDASSNQIVVAVFKTLEGDSIEDFTIRLAEKWGLGQKGRDNGVLLLIAKDDRKVRIEVGKGLEGAITDALSGRIIRDVLAPPFRAGQYAAGIGAAVEALDQASRGEFKPVAKKAKGNEKPPALLSIFFILMAVFVFFGIAMRNRAAHMGGRGGGPGIFFFPMGGFGGRGGGGFGGGGGFSGGGGSFGGGGASGGW